MKFIKSLRNNQESGFILAVFLITTVLIALVIVSVSSTATLDYSLSTRELYKANAQLAADAGLDKAIIDLTSDNTWSGSGGEVMVINNSTMRSTYQTTKSNGTSSSKKVISVIGRSYVPATASTARITRKYDMDVEAVTSGVGPSSVVSGVGGLLLNSNSKVTGGDVVVNGKVTINNNAQIGLSTNPVNVRVAHQSCPIVADTSYPRVCNAGENGQPITMGVNAFIYGNVQATNQTSGTNMSNPGLIPNSTFAPIPLPTYDRAGQKAAVTITKNPTDTGIVCSGGTASWPANLKINGNYSIPNNCSITINGNVWITGNVSMGNNSVFKVSNTLGTTRPTMMIDGSTGLIFGNNSAITANSSNTGAQIITYWSSAPCSPDCSTVTGASLAASQGVLTLDLSNNGSAPYSVLWAAWSKVRISNNGALGAITGQTVELGNNAVINFTATVPGSSNLITTWVKRGYMRTYN